MTLRNLESVEETWKYDVNVNLEIVTRELIGLLDELPICFCLIDHVTEKVRFVSVSVISELDERITGAGSVNFNESKFFDDQNIKLIDKLNKLYNKS